MGLYLSQLPPAELARLKAELAETLIEHFCYPRFMDYRTNTLRMRPVERVKRQEVWSFLSSYDFGPWGRTDIQSPEFQRLVERLLIQFIQRNRAFFGNQGRKRMTDVRALIGSSSWAVTEGLRGHLTGSRSPQASRAFGSPRPVASWSSSAVASDLSWEQVANATLLLQQQLQELRGEMQAEGDNGAHPYQAAASRPAAPAAPPRRSPRNRTGSNGSGKVQAVFPAISPVPPASSVPAVSAPRRVEPPAPPAAPAPPLRAGTTPRHIEDVETIPFSTNLAPQGVSGQPGFPAQAVRPATPAPQTPMTQAEPPSSPAPTPAPAPAPPSMRELSRTPSTALTGAQEASAARPEAANGSTLVAGDEDVVIFEQMKYQLVVWLRVEAVRQGLDIAGRTPSQLIDLLRHQEDFDETRLEVVNSLLQLADSVSAKGHATVLDYKQAMMFYLVHTRPAR